MNENWRVKKEISLGDLIAFFCAVAAVVVAYFTMDKRLVVVEANAQNQTQIDRLQDNTRDELKREILTRLNRMEDKLDRVIEKK